MTHVKVTHGANPFHWKYNKAAIHSYKSSHQPIIIIRQSPISNPQSSISNRPYQVRHHITMKYAQTGCFLAKSIGNGSEAERNPVHIITPACDPKHCLFNEIMKNELCKKNQDGGIMEEESWKSNHGRIMAEKSWRRNLEGGIREEEAWNRNHGGGIMKEE